MQRLPIIVFGEKNPLELSLTQLNNSKFVVYHGAREYFDTYDRSRIGQNSAISGHGIYTTTDGMKAEAYSRIRIGNSKATPIVIKFVPSEQKMLDLTPYYKDTSHEGFPKDFLVGFASYLKSLVKGIYEHVPIDLVRASNLEAMARRIMCFTTAGQPIYPQDLKQNFRINKLRSGGLPVVDSLKEHIFNNDMFDPISPLMGTEDIMSCFGNYIMTLGITGLIAPEDGESYSDKNGIVKTHDLNAYVFLDLDRIKTPVEWNSLK